MPATLHVSEAHELPSAAHWSQARVQQQADSDRRMQLAVLVCYVGDALLLAGYALCGVAPWHVPTLYLLTGLAMAAIFLPQVESDWYASMRSSGAVLFQSAAALAVQWTSATLAPALALPMVLTMVVVVPAAALRLPGRAALGLVALATITSLAVLHGHAGPLSVPLADGAERVVTVLFLAWTLAKGASIAIIGTEMRIELADSHARLAAALARVEALAGRDELTALPNRRNIRQILVAEHERMYRSAVPFSVAVLDIDHFKRINDTHGHAVGDAVLRAFAQILTRTLRENDRVGRYGGEEFLLVMPGPVNADGARRVGERLLQGVLRHDWSAIAPGLQVSASLGIAVAVPNEAPDDLVARADRSLYQAKHTGRNRVVVSDATPMPAAGTDGGAAPAPGTPAQSAAKQ